jgi:hypothetical protein
MISKVQAAYSFSSLLQIRGAAACFCTLSFSSATIIHHHFSALAMHPL